MTDEQKPDYRLFLMVLWEDVEEALHLLADADTQYNRRILLRVFFSAVEGDTYCLKQHLLDRLKANPALYSSGEVALLREETYNLDGKGEVVAQPRFLRISDNFRFTLKLFVNESLPGFDVTGDSVGWEAFGKSLKVRHRITHPKSDGDLYIAKDELENAKVALVWYRKTEIQAIIESHLILHEQFDALSKLRKSLGGLESGGNRPEVIPTETLKKMYEATKQWQAEL